MKAIIVPLFLLSSLSLSAQNLVPNSGFESYSALPDDGGQWYNVIGWTNAGGSPVQGYFGDPDYFHTAGIGAVKLPNTALAVVHPHDGDGIMGFLGYHDPYDSVANIREYLMVELTSPLTIGATYDVKFWITNGESGIGHYLQCDGIGINLSTTPLQQFGNGYIDRTPQMEVAGELFDTTWVQKSFTFTADSAYQYLTIGNFYRDSMTHVSVAVPGPLPFAGAYYFVDDFSVAPSTSDHIEDFLPSPFSLAPNPAQDQVLLRLPESQGTRARYEICDLQGQVLRSGTVKGSKELDLDGLAAGVYVVVVRGSSGILQRRLVKQ